MINLWLSVDSECKSTMTKWLQIISVLGLKNIRVDISMNPVQNDADCISVSYKYIEISMKRKH